MNTSVWDFGHSEYYVYVMIIGCKIKIAIILELLVNVRNEKIINVKFTCSVSVL